MLKRYERRDTFIRVKTMQPCLCVYIYIYTYLRTIVELCSHVMKSSYIHVIPTDTQVKGKSD